MIDALREFFVSFGDLGLVAWTLLKIIVIVLPITIGVAFFTLAERKVIGWMHVRHGPMYVGWGVLQAFAHVFKLLFKEVIRPTEASKALYVLAPLITLALIVINCLIFFGWQSGDEAKMEKAYRFYAESSLPTVEFPRYIEYLEQEGRDEDAASAQEALNADEPFALLQAMESDEAFMKQLRSGRVITPEDENYANWHRQRTEFDRRQQSTSVERFGFRPAAPTVQALFGHMFLHGGFDHLLGNMAILFIVGIAVDEALGKRPFLAFYLLAGLGAGVFDLVFNASRMAPGIGASGAISGVMAMFVVLYGLRKIRFFYWVLVYFDFIRAPALIVLPWWIANELYQYLFNTESMVNYMAHLGGFVSGALLIAAQRRFGKTRIVAAEQEAAADPLPGELARIMALFRDEGVGIEYLYASLEHKADRAIVVLKVDDVAAALDALERHGVLTVQSF